jgi:hypothetical protein
MCQPCFGKTIIMYKCVGVYIFVLMYNSSSMLYLGNIVEVIIKKLKKGYTFFLNFFFAMKWMQIFYTCIKII